MNLNTMAEKYQNNHTKERLLDTAEILFAQKGFHAVTVREITSTAKCNMAAINYHFNNKKNLYMEVFRSRWIPRERRMYEAFRKSIDAMELPSPSEVIRALARAYLDGSLPDKELRRHRQLIIRELNNPTEAFALAADQTLRTLYDHLYHLMTPFVPEGKKEGLSFDILSVFGIVLYFNYSRPMVSRITGREYDDDFKARLIDNVVRFSLNGLVVNGK